MFNVMQLKQALTLMKLLFGRYLCIIRISNVGMCYVKHVYVEISLFYLQS